MKKWMPSGPSCPRCGGPNPEGIKCGSCDHEPSDPIQTFEKNELFTKKQLRIRVAISKSLGYGIRKRLKKFL